VENDRTGEFREATAGDKTVLFPMLRALGRYRPTGYQDHQRLLMTKWLNRVIQ